MFSLQLTISVLHSFESDLAAVGPALLEFTSSGRGRECDDCTAAVQLDTEYCIRQRGGGKFIIFSFITMMVPHMDSVTATLLTITDLTSTTNILSKQNSHYYLHLTSHTSLKS